MRLLRRSHTTECSSYVITIGLDDEEHHQIYMPKYVADEKCVGGKWYIYNRQRDKNNGSGHKYYSILNAE